MSWQPTKDGLISSFQELKQLIETVESKDKVVLKPLLNELEDYILALDNSSILAVTDTCGIIIDVNETFSEISKYTREELIGQKHSLLKSGYHSNEFYKNLWDTISSGEVWEGEIKNKAKDGSYYWVKTKIYPFFNENGVPYKYISVRSDITRGKRYEERLRTALKNDFTTIVKSLQNFVFKVKKNSDGKFIFTLFEGKLAEEIGLNTKIVFSKTPFEILHKELAEQLNLSIEQAYLGESVRFENSFKGRFFHTTLSPIKKGEEVVSVVGSVSDISDLKKSELKIKHMAYHNQLTNLPNRQMFDEDLVGSLESVRKFKQSMSIVMLDLDHFKHINDSSGHSVGDAILLKIAKRLEQIDFLKLKVGQSAVYHLGGDEFIILLQEFKQKDIDKIVKNILSVFEVPFTYKDIEFYLSVSAGVSMYPLNGDSAEELLKNADTALFEAKYNGRNTYRLYSPEMNKNLLKKLQIETELRKALTKEDEFVLFYQPQIDLQSNKIVGVEALIRWIHPTRGFVSPGEFIPVAEDTGLVIPLGEWVLKRACQQMKQWKTDGIQDIKVSVNIATSHFQRPDFVEMILRVLKETGLESRSLELEITENSLMENTESSAKVLKRLKEVGIDISIDDFGTGYSSLGYLKSFPITTLKIDQSFVRDLVKDSDDRAIVTTIINLAKNLRMKVIAEGVETEETLQFLRSEGCHEMQGYLFSKPLQEEDLIPFIKKVNAI
ncbi:sensor domain-containing protein [Bacillus sp. FJAT-45350]|uniref:sensor domain-containing protein n=1 Tax=Bacillus sp. FJAT-45350 TaxID=2011014 RepID=UPI0015CA78D8|nr:EAL domain-containing protein [Bacillus sp. FJAT-45350]